MLDNNTISKLHEMKLSVMAAAFGKQLTDHSMNDLSFEERFGLLVDSEWVARKNNRLTRLIKNAGYAFTDACLEDIESMLLTYGTTTLVRVEFLFARSSLSRYVSVRNNGQRI